MFTRTVLVAPEADIGSCVEGLVTSKSIAMRKTTGRSRSCSPIQRRKAPTISLSHRKLAKGRPQFKVFAA